MKALLTFALCVSAASASVAATNGEEDTLVINRISATDFEVIELQQMGPAEFWCGAATYIERRRKLSETTPIYLRGARGPSRTQPGRKGVVFSTSNRGLPPPDPKQLTVTVRKVGAVLKSVQARRFCRDAFTRSTK